MFSDILLTVDYDRTLTAPDSTIPERNVEAIRYFMENGGAFTVNTGRSLPMTHVLRNVIPVNAPLLLYNGAASYDQATGKLTASRVIQLPMEQTLREVMEAFPDLTLEVQGKDFHYAFQKNILWEGFSDFSCCPWAYAQPGDDLGPFLKFTVYGPFRDAVLGSMFTTTPTEELRMAEAERLLRQRYGSHCEVVRTAKIIDLQPKGLSKNSAAKALQKQLGRKILVCVGDGENDVPMLLGADYAYAPSDGVVADRFENVCRCAEGSVADVIYKKIPEILEKTLDNGV